MVGIRTKRFESVLLRSLHDLYIPLCFTNFLAVLEHKIACEFSNISELSYQLMHDVELVAISFLFFFTAQGQNYDIWTTIMSCKNHVISVQTNKEYCPCPCQTVHYLFTLKSNLRRTDLKQCITNLKCSHGPDRSTTLATGD